MSDFAGIFRTDGGPVDEASLQRISRLIQGEGKVWSWRPDPSVLLVEQRGKPGYDNGSRNAPGQRDPDRWILATARLDAPQAVQAALGLEGKLPDDRSLIAAAALRWGPGAAAERIHGDFAVLEWDARARRLTIARDAMGARPVYTVTVPGMVIVATTLQMLMGLPEVPRELNDIAIAHTMAIGLQDLEQTLYRHIRRVPPGGTAIFENGGWRITRWYTADRIAPVRLKRDEDYVEAARAELDRAVACRLSADGRNATTLSGGFDSSGVTATAARLLGDRGLTSFTRANGADYPDYGFDERGLASLVPARYPNIEWVVIDDAREAIRDLEPESEFGPLLVPRQSSFNGTWFESMYLAIEQRKFDVLLNGGTGNSTLSWAGEPDFAARLRRMQFGGMIRDIRRIARQRRHTPWRTAMSVAWHKLAPRTWRRRALGRHGDAGRPWLSYSLVSPDFLESIDYAREAEAVGNDIPFSPNLSSKELRLRMMQGQRGRDMSGFARQRWSASGRDPYLDRGMVELTLGMPVDQFWRDGVDRWLARRVLADRVPAEILNQTIKGRQSPEWYFLASRRREQMLGTVERLSRSRAASRVIDLPRIRRLLEDWPKDAEAAQATEVLHGHAINRAISMGGFLRWHEGGNE